MFVLRSDRTVWCDVDDTLIGWGKAPQDRPVRVTIECGGFVDNHWVIEENVEALKLHKARGHKIIVWSQGGFDWAEAVVKALGLEELVDFVCSKPTWVYDDLQPAAWMPKAKFGKKDPSRQESDLEEEKFDWEEIWLERLKNA